MLKLGAKKRRTLALPSGATYELRTMPCSTTKMPPSSLDAPSPEPSTSPSAFEPFSSSWISPFCSSVAVAFLHDITWDMMSAARFAIDASIGTGQASDDCRRTDADVPCLTLQCCSYIFADRQLQVPGFETYQLSPVEAILVKPLSERSSGERIRVKYVEGALLQLFIRLRQDARTSARGTHSAAALSVLLVGVQMTSPARYVTSCPAATISSNSASGTFAKNGSARRICAVGAQ